MFLTWRNDPSLTVALHHCRKEDKLAALIWTLREFVSEGQPSIVFTSTRHHVEFLHSILQAAGLSVACVYGAMDQVEISRSYASFFIMSDHLLELTSTVS